MIMPTDNSRYTDDILAFMRDAGRPVTISEVQEAVGMSRPAAYQWRDRNAYRLRRVGKGRHGADAFVLVEDAQEPTVGSGRVSATWQVTEAGSGAPGVASVAQGSMATAVAADLRLGQRFHVAGMQLADDGRTVVTLAGEDGATITVLV